MELIESIKTILLQIKDVLVNIDIFPDVIDILLVAVLAYGLITQLRKSQSIQVIKGIILVALVYGLVNLLDMTTSKFIFSKMFSDIIIIVVVLFSTELRHALENVGKKKLGKKYLFFSSSSADEETIEAINSACRAAGAMSRSKVGSLIVFQRDSLLGDLTKHAVPIDSATTFEMLCSIFYPKAPLHDGAVVIKDGRIVAARCVVPMKNDRIINENVGTRHRAALEVSLNSDAVVVVTSEESGIISLAVDGKLIRGLSDSELRERLSVLLLNPKAPKKSRAAKKSKPVFIETTDEAQTTENANETEASDEIIEEEIVSAIPEVTDINDTDISIEEPFEDCADDLNEGIKNEGVENDEQE